MRNLVDDLIEYSQTDFYPFHMPGHKRREECAINPYSYDVTEVDGMDNLYEAEGLLKEAMERASSCYGSNVSFFLVNGSTCGIMTSIFSTMQKGDRVLMARNCHGSVYKSVYLRGLQPEYIYPEYVSDIETYGSVNPKDIEDKLQEYDDIKAVIITSPTYEGVVSDIKSISDIVHRYNKILIVDEAHGSHLGFHTFFPEGAIKCGADIVIHSLHKTMKGLTQTGLLHICSDRVDAYEIKRYLGMFQTSSPSYVLMGSIDKNVCQLKEFGALLFEKYVENLKKFTKNVENLTNTRLLNVENLQNMSIFDMDRGKLSIIIDSKYKDAKYLYDTLRDKYHLQMEMLGKKSVLAMTSIADEEEGFERLFKALEEIDREIRIDEVYFQRDRRDSLVSENEEMSVDRAIVKMSPSDVENHKKEFLNIAECVGKISCEYIYMYPPGIPILAPGEMITENIVKSYETYKNKGYNVYGPRFNEEGKIQVIKEDFQAIRWNKI